MKNLIEDLHILTEDIHPYIKQANVVIQKLSKISKEVLDIYSSIKQEDYISLILGGASTVGVLVENLISADKDYNNILSRIGVHKICPSIDDFVYNILKQTNVSV